MEKVKVYFTSKITSDSLIKIYEKLGVKLEGNIGIKVSTGEKGSKGYLNQFVNRFFIYSISKSSTRKKIIGKTLAFFFPENALKFF